MSDFIFFLVVLALIILVIRTVYLDNKKRENKEQHNNTMIDSNGDEILRCYWCGEVINSGAKICRHCRKVPTKTGNDNKQIKIFVTILLIIAIIIVVF